MILVRSASNGLKSARDLISEFYVEGVQIVWCTWRQNTEGEIAVGNSCNGGIRL